MKNKTADSRPIPSVIPASAVENLSLGLRRRSRQDVAADHETHFRREGGSDGPTGGRVVAIMDRHLINVAPISTLLAAAGE